MLKRKTKVYLSHPIRGFMGRAATLDVMTRNNDKAIAWGRELWAYFGSQLEVYIPAEHDEFVLIAHEKNYLDIHQILDVDCDIVAKREAVIVADWESHISGGMQREINHANSLDIPVWFFNKIDIDSLEQMEIFLGAL